MRAQEQIIAVFATDVLELRTADAKAAGEVGLHQGIDLVAVEAAVGKHGEGEQAGGGGAAVGFVVAHDAVSLFVSGLLQGPGRPGGETSVPLQTGAD